MTHLDDVNKVLKENKKNLKDIKWIGSEKMNFKIPFDKFRTEIIGADSNLKINPTLLIVGDNWWLSRKDDEWIYHKYPAPKRLMKLGKSIFME